MVQQLPRLPPNFARMPDRDELLQRYWQDLVTMLEEVPAIQDALVGLDTAVADAQAAADSAQAAADTAQTAADNAQATADSIVVPPTGVRNLSGDASLTPDDVTVLVDASGGVVNIDLSLAAGYAVPVVITKTDSSGNAVSVFPSGSDSLNGGAGPVSLTFPSESRPFTADQVDQWFG